MSVIRILTHDPDATFQRRVIAGVKSAAHPRGMSVQVETPPSSALFAALSDQPEGLLVIANAVSSAILRHINEQGRAVTLVSHRVQGLAIPSVMFNNAQGMGLLVRHLLHDCGRRQLVFVRGIAEQIDAIQREAAFRNEIMRHGINPDSLRYLSGEFSPAVAAESVMMLLRERVSFDAVIAADYLMANAITDVLRGQGIAVPEQVAVVGFGDTPEATDANLTTVKANVEALGYHAGLQLISQVNGARIGGVTSLAVQLLVRGSSC
ncbi:MAG: LacI family DNA-binding transcriptional regulator [Phototrophicaceae bacterium]